MYTLSGQASAGKPFVSGTILKFCKGEIIYCQGDTAADWFEVISGTVRTCLLYSDGHRQLTGFFYPSDVFGIDSGHYASSAEAVTAVSLRRCSRGFGKEDMIVDPLPVQGALRRALDCAQACISLLGRRTAAERLAAFLIATADRFVPGKPFALPMSRSDIADHLGLTIHTVSRTLSQLVRRNLIRLNGPQTIAILDYSQLKQLADGNESDSDRAFALPMMAQCGAAEHSAQLGA